MEAARLLVELGLRPRRTVRVVLWTNEEIGVQGGRKYAEALGDDIGRHVAGIEADAGLEAPWGFGVGVRDPGGESEDGGWTKPADEARQARAAARLRELAPLLTPVGADSIRSGGGGVDIGPLMNAGMPGLGLQTPMKLYWDIHHTHADTMDKVDPESLRRNVAAMAVMAFVLAEMPDRL
jgi:Zn-dependent M28 family amino/carboxypeptidase